MHDPHYFPEPNTFNPERFREKVDKLEGNVLHSLNGLDKDDPSAVVFGFGRRQVKARCPLKYLAYTDTGVPRICPGRYFVDANLWLMMSNILTVFDIGPPLDSSGKPQSIGEIKYTDGMTR